MKQVINTGNSLTYLGIERAGYTPQEVMKLTNSSRSFIYSAISQGRLKAARIGPRKLLITPAALENFLKGEV